MDNYWEQRYRGEGKIWGDRPSVTAAYACRHFLGKGVKSVFIPGIGYGRNARTFVAEGMVVSGIEVSDGAVRILKHDLPDVQCHEGSVLDIPFGGPYDAIYCFNVLHLFRADDRRTFLGNCREALADGGLAFFTVFSEKEPSYGKGAEVEPCTFESKPGRPVHYYSDEDLRSQFMEFNVLESGLIEDPEDHGTEGPHVHILRYVLAQNPCKSI